MADLGFKIERRGPEKRPFIIRDDGRASLIGPPQVASDYAAMWDTIQRLEAEREHLRHELDERPIPAEKKRK